MPESTWETIVRTIAASPCPVTVLEADDRRAAECLNGLGITTRSWLGAVVAHTGGLLVDHGWLRVLGSGTASLPDVRADTGLTVAFDVLGGRYRWAVNGDGKPTIHYFAPDDLAWQDLGLGYGDWLAAVLSGALDDFYASLRWQGWQREVAALRPDEGVHSWPPPWSAEGKDLSAVSRAVVPLAELISAHTAAADQVLAPPDGAHEHDRVTEDADDLDGP